MTDSLATGLMDDVAKADEVMHPKGTANNFNSLANFAQIIKIDATKCERPFFRQKINDEFLFFFQRSVFKNC